MTHKTKSKILGKKRRPRSDCADALSDLGLCFSSEDYILSGLDDIYRKLSSVNTKYIFSVIWIYIKAPFRVSLFHSCVVYEGE